jgi:prepilin-type N-terminal cleavage/methylation domain-containing protein
MAMARKNNRLITMKLKFSRVQATKSQAGFSMLETMVASMIGLIFMSMGANLVLAANIQKIVAKRNVTMNNLAQSDLDGIRSQANYLEKDLTGNKCSATNPADTTQTGLSAYGYAAALMRQLGSSNTSSPLYSSTPMKVMDRNYAMTRTIGISNDNHRILTVHYKFIYGGTATTPSTDTTKPDYELYTEVIPNAVYTCVGTTLPVT